MRLVYFASVREQIGLAEEEVAPPANVKTIADLLAWLVTRGEQYRLFENAATLRAAINQEHVGQHSLIDGAKEIALFPPMTGG